MRLVKAAKASPHAKFYNLGTGYTRPKNTRNVNRIVHHLLNMFLYEKFIFKTASVHFSTFEKSQKTCRTCTYERYLKFFVATKVLPPTTLKKHVWSDRRMLQIIVT